MYKLFSKRKISLYILFFNWASFLSWQNYPKHFRVGVAIWWSSLQMMLTLKLEGQPYGEVKNKICWPSKSSYQPPNGVRYWQWCIWEQRVKTDCRSFIIVNCVRNLFIFAYVRSPSWGLWTVQTWVTNLRCSSKGLVVIYIFMHEIKYFMICQSNILRNQKASFFPK